MYDVIAACEPLHQIREGLVMPPIKVRINDLAPANWGGTKFLNSCPHAKQ